MFLQTLIVVISPLLFAGIAWYFMKSRKELQEEEKLEVTRVNMHDQEISEDELRIKNELEETRLKGEMVVKLSEKIAQDILAALEQTLGEKIDSFQSVVPDGNNFESQITSISTSIKNKYLGKINQMVNSLDEFEKQKAHNIVSFIDSEYEKSEKSMDEIRATELRNLKDKMDRYKEEELRLFDQKVKTAIDAAVMDVLGKALTSTEQEELIIKALDEAKKNNAV